MVWEALPAALATLPAFSAGVAGANVLSLFVIALEAAVLRVPFRSVLGDGRLLLEASLPRARAHVSAAAAAHEDFRRAHLCGLLLGLRVLVERFAMFCDLWVVGLRLVVNKKTC